MPHKGDCKRLVVFLFDLLLLGKCEALKVWIIVCEVCTNLTPGLRQEKN